MVLVLPASAADRVGLAERNGTTIGDDMSEPTVRERVRRIQVNLRDGALTPDMARESLVTLTALLPNVHQEQRIADLEYNRVLLKELDGEGAKNRAKIRAQVTPEYQRSREAKDIATEVVEMIRSCKVYIRSLDNEVNLAR